MTNNFINSINLITKNDYHNVNNLVTVGGYYLNDLLVYENNNHNNNTLKRGGAIYSKLENYGVPPGLYVSPIPNSHTLHKIETVIVENYDLDKMKNLHDKLYTGIIHTVNNNSRKHKESRKKEKTRKR